MRKILLAAVAALSFCTPVAAPAASVAPAAVCQPLPVIAAELQALGVKRDQIFATDDLSFVRIYHTSAGLPLPEGSAPVGMIVVISSDKAVVGLVERPDGGAMCVRHVVRIPLVAHKKALASANVTA